MPNFGPLLALGSCVLVALLLWWGWSYVISGSTISTVASVIGFFILYTMVSNAENEAKKTNTLLTHLIEEMRKK